MYFLRKIRLSTMVVEPISDITLKQDQTTAITNLIITTVETKELCIVKHSMTKCEVKT